MNRISISVRRGAIVPALIAALALVAGSPGLAQTRPNPAQLTEAMIAPCNAWLAIRIARYSDPVGISNLDMALSIPPYHPSAGGPYDLQSTRMFIQDWEQLVPIMEGRDEAGMRRRLGGAIRGAQYWDRLANDERFLCLLYVRRKQLTGQAFSRVIPTPASLGFQAQR